MRCRFPISGGLLTRRAAGELSFTQLDGDRIELRSAIRGFYPALAAHEGRRDWTGALYTSVQSRIHVAISRRYFARLAREGGSEIAVFGATGTIGAALLPVLAESHEVVGISRGVREAPTASNGAQADATDAEAVRRALDGVDVVYYLVHSLGSRRLRGSRPSRCRARVAAEAERAGVRQLIYLGGLGDTRPSSRRTCAAASRPAGGSRPEPCR